MNIDKAEKATIQFRTKIDRMLASENGIDLLSKESEHFKKMIDEINGRVRTYDNNLGFFKTSKGKSDFLIEIEEKLAAEKQKLQELTAKRKLINEELNKLRNASTQSATA
jgi:prophage DNA circulation protein